MCKLYKYPRLTTVGWRDDFELHPGLIIDNLMGPGRFYELERHSWIDLWRAPVFEALEDSGIEMRGYGPLWTFTVADLRLTPLLNLLLGGERPGAVEGGHLEAALEWTESLGADCRIPIRPEFGEARAAEELLAERGYGTKATQALLLRDASPPGPADSEGIEIDEHSEEVEGFSELFVAGYGLGSTANDFFAGLPGRRRWRSYIAFDPETEYGMGAATTMLHPEQIAQLGFAATCGEYRGRGVHSALIRRRVADAIAAGARTILAVAEEPLDYPSEESTAAANLARAGFAPRDMRTVWRPPEHLLADEEGEDEDERDDDWGEDGDDWRDGFDEDHDFRLQG